MYGTLANNSIILHLMKRHLIDIKPFDKDLLKTAHYPLRAYGVYVRQEDGAWRQAHSFDESRRPFVFRANQYVMIEVNEQIVIKQGIVAKFVAASNLVEQGLGLTAGRLEYPFGKQGETLRFGLKNQNDGPAELAADDYVAYVEFYDLRALRLRPTPLSPRDRRIYAGRVNEERFAHANDDGVRYEDDDDDFLDR